MYSVCGARGLRWFLYGPDCQAQVTDVHIQNVAGVSVYGNLLAAIVKDDVHVFNRAGNRVAQVKWVYAKDICLTDTWLAAGGRDGLVRVYAVHRGFELQWTLDFCSKSGARALKHYGNVEARALSTTIT